MTTIAFRAGLIASDSRGTWGDFICPDKVKKMVVSEKHGCVYAIAGSYPHAVRFIRVLDSLDRLPWNEPSKMLDFAELQGDEEQKFSIVVLQWDGRLFTFEAGIYAEIITEFYSIGSGAQAALAAMTMGADAMKAIQIASTVDCGTDSNIVCYGVEELTKPAYLSARVRSPKPRARPTQAAPARSKSRASRKKPA